jgi:dsRNA-specific ribonuclease
MEDNTNERLEYLGDSVIALTVSHYRHERYKDQNEGFFDETQNATGIRGHLRKLAVEIGLRAG